MGVLRDGAARSLRHWWAGRSRVRRSFVASPRLGAENRPRRETQSRTPRNRSALVTTDTDDRLIASAATIGDKTRPRTGYSTPAASGTPTALYTNAKNRFWRMLRTVARDNARARPIAESSPRTSVT